MYKGHKSRDNFAPSASIDRRRWDNIFKDDDDSLLHDPNSAGCDNILKDEEGDGSEPTMD